VTTNIQQQLQQGSSTRVSFFTQSALALSSSFIATTVGLPVYNVSTQYESFTKQQASSSAYEAAEFWKKQHLSLPLSHGNNQKHSFNNHNSSGIWRFAQYCSRYSNTGTATSSYLDTARYMFRSVLYRHYIRHLLTTSVRVGLQLSVYSTLHNALLARQHSTTSLGNNSLVAKYPSFIAGALTGIAFEAATFHVKALKNMYFSIVTPHYALRCSFDYVTNITAKIMGKDGGGSSATIKDLQLSRQVAKESFKLINTGFVTSLASQALHKGLYFGLFELCKVQQQDQDEFTRLATNLVIALGTGSVAFFAIAPLRAITWTQKRDAIKHEQQRIDAINAEVKRNEQLPKDVKAFHSIEDQITKQLALVKQRPLEYGAAYYNKGTTTAAQVITSWSASSLAGIDGDIAKSRQAMLRNVVRQHTHIFRYNLVPAVALAVYDALLAHINTSAETAKQ